eukprot:926017_1
MTCSARTQFCDGSRCKLVAHALLPKVRVCEACALFYQEGKGWDKADDGADVFCRWCGEGGDIAVCDKDSCRRGWCRLCCERHGSGVWEKTSNENSEQWLCFYCDPSQIVSQQREDVIDLSSGTDSGTESCPEINLPQPSSSPAPQLPGVNWNEWDANQVVRYLTEQCDCFPRHMARFLALDIRGHMLKFMDRGILEIEMEVTDMKDRASIMKAIKVLTRPKSKPPQNDVVDLCSESSHPSASNSSTPSRNGVITILSDSDSDEAEIIEFQSPAPSSPRRHFVGQLESSKRRRGRKRTDYDLVDNPLEENTSGKGRKRKRKMDKKVLVKKSKPPPPPADFQYVPSVEVVEPTDVRYGVSTHVEPDPVSLAVSRNLGMAIPEIEKVEPVSLEIPDSARIVLILGPSGAGKTTFLRSCGDLSPKLHWDPRQSVISLDNFGDTKTAFEALQSIGFNSVPSWFKAYPVLSQGEKYRARLARMHCLNVEELKSDRNHRMILDEFTSNVDRAVAKSTASSISKWIRRKNSRAIFACANGDIVPYLQPDMVISLARGRPPRVAHNPNPPAHRKPSVRAAIPFLPIRAENDFFSTSEARRFCTLVKGKSRALNGFASRSPSSSPTPSPLSTSSSTSSRAQTPKPNAAKIEKSTSSQEKVEKSTSSQGNVEKSTSSQEKVEKSTSSQENVSTSSLYDIDKLTSSQDYVDKSTSSQDNIEKSTSSQDTIEKSISLEENVDNSMSSQENVDMSMSSQDNVEKSVSSQYNVDKSTSSQENIDKLMSSQENVDKSVSYQENVDKSMNSQDIIEKSTSSQGNVEKSTSSQENVSTSSLYDIDKLTSSQDYVDKSTSSQDNIEKSTSSQDTIEKSISLEENVDNSMSSQENVEKSTSSQDNVYKSTGSQYNVDKLMSSQENVDKSVSYQENVDKSMNSQDIIEKSTSSQGNVEKSTSSQGNVEKSTS